MTKTILLSLITILCFSPVFADAPSPNDGEEMTYRLRAKIPMGLVNKYRFSEVQDIKREIKVGDDWEEVNVKRKVDIFYSMRAANKLENGFTEVKVTVDTVRYSYIKPNKEVTYDSWDISAFPPINEYDFLRYGLATEMDYEFFYSPYSEVSKVTGALLEQKRELFIGPDAPANTMTELLKDYLRDEMIVFIFDPVKNILPDYDIKLEDTWTPPMRLEMGGYWWEPKPEFSIINYDRSGFLIESELDSVMMPPTRAYFADMASYGDIKYSNVNGKISGYLNTQGVQESVVLNLDVYTEGDLGGRDFRQTQDLFYTWELIATYKF